MSRLIKILPLLFCVFLLAACDSGDKKESAPAEAEKAAPVTPDDSAPADAAPPQASLASPDAAADPDPGPEDPADLALEAEQAAPVALVGGVPISRRLFENQVVMTQNSLALFGFDPAGAEPATEDALRLEVLENLIQASLAAQEAMKRGYGPSPEELDTALKRLESDFESPEAFQTVMADYASSPAEIKSQLAKNFALEKWQEAEFQKAAVTDEEVRKFYDDNKADMAHDDLVEISNILIELPPDATAEQREAARKKADAALKALKEGRPFTEVAAETSEDPSFPENKGHLGWTSREQLGPDFEKPIFGLKPGEYSDVIESPRGLHIFQVTALKPAGVMSFDEVKPDLAEYLKTQKANQAILDEVDALRKTADVKIIDDGLKSIYDKAEAEDKTGE